MRRRGQCTAVAGGYWLIDSTGYWLIDSTGCGRVSSCRKPNAKSLRRCIGHFTSTASTLHLAALRVGATSLWSASTRPFKAFDNERRCLGNAQYSAPGLRTTQPCSNSPSWPSRSRCLVSVVTHSAAPLGHRKWDDGNNSSARLVERLQKVERDSIADEIGVSWLKASFVCLFFHGRTAHNLQLRCSVLPELAKRFSHAAGGVPALNMRTTPSCRPQHTAAQHTT